uniref:Uncharacterized protein n=1 Tax=Nelumbo nucifera TaxID=4432 RepID=A0A822XKD0_NELNU|nr:TPA_asm: hypothetical protein HUJ06_019480 [Nelumbo nucifera]
MAMEMITPNRSIAAILLVLQHENFRSENQKSKRTSLLKLTAWFRDPLDNYKRYTGGWNISERHF